MLSIRMRRTGAKKNPHFRVVVADSSNSRDGAFIAVLGHYHPRFEPARLVLDIEALKGWIDKGAQPSDTVRTLLKQVETGQLQMLEEPAAAEEPVAAEAAGDEEAAGGEEAAREEEDPGEEAEVKAGAAAAETEDEAATESANGEGDAEDKESSGE